MRDGAEVDARFEQVNSGAVAQAVWVDSFAFKRRQSLRSAFNVFSQDEACAEAGERIATLVPKHRLCFVRTEANCSVEVLLQQLSGLRPEGTDAFFTAVAKKRQAWRRGQSKVTGFK